MTRRSVLILTAAFFLFTASTIAQSKDFSGTWVPDATKSGDTHHAPTLVITMDTKTISLRPVDEKHALVFNLDGSETTQPLGARGKAAWRGSKLELTLITPRGPQSMTWSRDGDWLVQESQGRSGAVTVFFKRQSAGRGGR